MNDTAKLILGIVGGFLALVLLLLLAGVGMSGRGPIGTMWPMMGGFGSWWMLAPVLFWIGLLVLIGWAIIRIFTKGGLEDGEPGRDNAEEVLRERFARGEVEAEEYERSLQVLRGNDHNDQRKRSRKSNLN